MLSGPSLKKWIVIFWMYIVIKLRETQKTVRIQLKYLDARYLNLSLCFKIDLLFGGKKEILERNNLFRNLVHDGILLTVLFTNFSEESVIEVNLNIVRVRI